MSKYIVMVGTSYLTDYSVMQDGVKNEVIANIRASGINAQLFQYQDEARVVANALGGKMIPVKEDEHE